MHPYQRQHIDPTGILPIHEQLSQPPLPCCRKVMQRVFEELAHPYERLEDDVPRCVRMRYHDCQGKETRT